MSHDFYGAQWGPGGPGGEQVPPQLWPFGDQGPLDPALRQQFDVADVMWRMGVEQQRAAEMRAADAGALPGPVLEPDSVGFPPAPDLPLRATVHLPGTFGAGSTGGDTAWFTDGRRALPAASAANLASVATPASSTESSYSEPYRPGMGTAVAVLGVAAVVALAVATSGESKPANSPSHRVAPPAAAAAAPEGYTCAVVGVSEVSPYTGSVTLSATAGGRPVWVGNNVQADAARPEDTTFTFDASNMHGQTVTVSVGNTNCEGSFNLGQVGVGDETSRSS